MSHIKTIIIDLNEFRIKKKDVKEFLSNISPIRDIVKIVICDIGPMTARNIKAGLSKYRKLYPEWEHTLKDFPIETIENTQNELLNYVNKIMYINELCLFEDSDLKQKSFYLDTILSEYKNFSLVGFSYLPEEIKERYNNYIISNF